MAAGWSSPRHYYRLVGTSVKVAHIDTNYVVRSIVVTSVIAANAWTNTQTFDLTKWGTASDSLVPGTSALFDTAGVLRAVWLANLPQILLSLVYFAINRVCTSVCFSIEWNEFAVKRKGLRVTSPKGLQRPTHFLQIPYRWAVPLIATSALMQWLLSQSIFLVRIEMRDTSGRLSPTSKCACGYSPLSFLVFFIVFFTFLGVILCFILRVVEIRIPPARHRSFIISAACHPPPNDIDAHLKEVQWGVTKSSSERLIGHCTFTSEEVTAPREARFYM